MASGTLAILTEATLASKYNHVITVRALMQYNSSTRSKKIIRLGNVANIKLQVPTDQVHLPHVSRHPSIISTACPLKGGSTAASLSQLTLGERQGTSRTSLHPSQG